MRSPARLLPALIPTLAALACPALGHPDDEARSDAPRSATKLDPAEAKQLAAAQLELARDLLGALEPADKQKNLVLSPWSIWQALAMTSAGARGETADELRQVLHAPLAPERLHAAVGALELELNARSQAKPGRRDGRPFTIRSANALWGQSGHPFQAPFLRQLAESYGAGMHLVDFRQDPDGARERINAWVADATQQKIKDLLRAPVPNAATRLALVNAVYFLADWDQPFERDDTRPAPFTRLDGTQVQVPTMHQFSHLSLVELPGARAVGLPYAGRQATCWLILPEQRDQLDRVAGQLPALCGKLGQGKIAYVQLALPKLRFTWRAGLVDALERLGLEQATDPSRADFSGMDGTRQLFVGSVTHQAFLGVDERGTEAAAATVVEMAAGGMPPKPVPFLLDRPFLLLIRDDATGAPLFLARVIDPSLE